ncbi:hypothetical protein Tbis_2660 [Thermobispora bispora DSM 43833]|uniref:Uncharacterized protein n=1 Tax=Thermobispora bispora (strain ATCC 19993 / DSM 43833 / CBS 139.67 / JCM 10125 / KCTC 9307 / NBRC 14880 / R51) TaxID=469371 RepID=D6Y5G6_THEBD|nr:hypothetical protein Tbis_2660 [Thermobispora bispora DSM 43833]
MDVIVEDLSGRTTVAPMSGCARPGVSGRLALRRVSRFREGVLLAERPCPEGRAAPAVRPAYVTGAGRPQEGRLR